jgi:hypothetical protein
MEENNDYSPVKNIPDDIPDRNQATGFRYVAICDILGFKQLTKSLTLEELTHKINVLFRSSKYLVHTYSNYSPEKPSSIDVVNMIVFSDTFLLFSLPIGQSTKYFGVVSSFFDVITSLLGYCIFNEVPIRVGVAFGETYISLKDNIYLGLPLVHAYEIEKDQDWIGGACHQSCEKAPFFNEYVNRKWNQVIWYPVPTHNGNRNLWSLNWLFPTAVMSDLEKCKEYLLNEATRIKEIRYSKKYSEAFRFLELLIISEPYKSYKTYMDVKKNSDEINDLQKRVFGTNHEHKR